MNTGSQQPAYPLLQSMSGEMTGELREILGFWKTIVLSPDGTSFHGSVDNHNEPDPQAVKGLVMHARILWSFSSANAITKDDDDLRVAGVAYRYLLQFFNDGHYGGFYWSLTAAGEPLETRKQVYGQAFCLYAVAAYYERMRDPLILEQAVRLFHLIEEKSRDVEKGGYIEAFNRDWSPASEMRLSAKDQNERKTANTHLHVIEAYAGLYKVWPDPVLKQRIAELLGLFNDFFIDRASGVLHLFFNDDWQQMSSLRSYGHEIETSWLLYQCALVTGDESLELRFRGLALLMKEAAAEGLDEDGALWYESDPASGIFIREKHWWPQAEAVVGYLNAWQLSGKPEDLWRAVNAWEFIKTDLRDQDRGEWYWGINADRSIIAKEKAGFWKCPYHNSRACIEVITRSATAGALS